MNSELRRIAFTPEYLQDLKRLKKKHVDVHAIDAAVRAIMQRETSLLATKYRDHALGGQWRGFRELHISGDWLLIYCINDDALTLVLTRTGSHDRLLSSRVDARTIRGYWRL